MADRFCWNAQSCQQGAPDDHGSIHCSLVDSIEGIDVVDESGIQDPAELRSHNPFACAMAARSGDVVFALVNNSAVTMTIHRYLRKDIRTICGDRSPRSVSHDRASELES